MNTQNRIIWRNRRPEYGRRFLQPIAVTIVCTVFISLILIMGIMDIRRSDRSLVGFMESQGMATIGVVERLAQENLNALIQAYQRDSGGTYVPVPPVDEALLPQKSLTAALVDMGREIDNQWKAGYLSDEYLRKFAEEKGLWFVAVLDRKGKVVYQNRTLQADLIGGDPDRVLGRDAITIDLFSRLGKDKKIGFVALRRTDGSGTVIIALDRDEQRYWGVKVSVEKALERLGQGQGLVYIKIMDQRGMLLGSLGQVPDTQEQGKMPIDEILAGTKKFESRKIVSHDKKILEIAAPIYLFGKMAGVARLGLDREATDEILAENKNNMIFFMASVILITLLAMWILYHNQNRHLAGIVEMERQLEKAERLSALGQLAAGVAHEIRNPLNAISMASQRLKREFMPADENKIKEFQTLAGVIRDEIRRLDGIIEEFLTFSKSRRLELHNYPVAEVLQKIVNVIQEEAKLKGITLETMYKGNHAIIPMDVDKFQQAIFNLVKNAMESISGEGAVRILVDSSGKNRVIIKISDNGCGMTAEEMERIFNPEYTTKEKGLGLGLPLAHEIIRGHGGEIRVLSQPGSGTTFEISLPAGRPGEKDGMV